MKTDQFSINITGHKELYECKVEEHKEKKETFYLVDILSPQPFDDGKKITDREHYIEMRLDCKSGNFKIKPYFKNILEDLL